jgi:multicomponent Na+:H+ antiporter subunit E
MYRLSWILALAVFWLLLSGYFKGLLLSFGVISVALVVVALTRMDKVDARPQSLRLNHRLLLYFAWLILEVIRSSLEVAKLVWLSPKNIQPALGVIKTQAKPNTGSVLYANSITLTPGTLSVDLSENEVTVHALQASSLEELREGNMERHVNKASGGNSQ